MRINLKRKESEATRKRRADHARYQQGLNGKWESNENKAKARKVRRACSRLAPMFERARARKKAADSAGLREARALSAEIEAATDEQEILALMPRLGNVTITPAILRKTLIAKKLNAIARRVPAVKGAVQSVIAKWKATFRNDVAKAKEAAEAPGSAARKARRSLPQSLPAAAGNTPSPAEKRPPLLPTTGKPRGTSSSSSSSSSSSTSSSSVCEQVSTVAPAPRKTRPLKQRRITAFLSTAGA